MPDLTDSDNDSNYPGSEVSDSTLKRIERTNLDQVIEGGLHRSLIGVSNLGKATVPSIELKTIGGWVHDTTKLSSGSVSFDGVNELILMGAATAPLTGVGIYMGKDSSDYELRFGDPSGSYIHWNGSTLVIGGTLSGDLTIAATSKFVFDGSGDTYIHEVSADQLDIVVGGVTILEIKEAGVANIFTVNVSAVFTGLVSASAGVYNMSETTTPAPQADAGQIYTKTDNKLYFQDGAGSEHEVAFV